MPASIHHGLRSPEDLSAFGRIVGWAFGFPEKEASEWLEHSGTDNLRLYSSDGAVRGGLLTIPMGQYFGGKAVPMVGIAGVAAAPEARGKGLALELMHATVRELHDKGVALSTLYPATLTLYRKAGYALAGSLFDVRMPAARIPPPSITCRCWWPPVRPRRPCPRASSKGASCMACCRWIPSCSVATSA